MNFQKEIELGNLYITSPSIDTSILVGKGYMQSNILAIGTNIFPIKENYLVRIWFTEAVKKQHSNVRRHQHLSIRGAIISQI